MSRSDPNPGPCRSGDATARTPPSDEGAAAPYTGGGSRSLLENVVCNAGLFKAYGENYDKYEERFCKFLESQATLATMAGREIFQDVCNGPAGADLCTIVLDVTFNVAGNLARDTMSSICRPIFNELYTNCNGNRGFGDLTIGAETGVVSITIGSEDRHEICPKPDGFKTICEATSLYD